MRPQAGFAYVLLLVAIAIIGVAASATLGLGAAMGRRDAERELLAIGAEFQQALRSYAGAVDLSSPIAAGRGPRSLDDLLKDPRSPQLRRHLRQLRADPLTGRAEWGLVTDPQGAITGVYSLAPGRPFKRSSFEGAWAAFEDAESYRDWVFGTAPMPRALASPSR
jgi:type II secretory pathway pseudopilin PulG